MEKMHTHIFFCMSQIGDFCNVYNFKYLHYAIYIIHEVLLY